MNNVHGIIYAFHTYEELRELGTHRTGASLPFCGRYRMIDFAMSSMMHAGIHDVGVIMHRGYQSLLNHLSSGRPWDMSRWTGGLTTLPPYGLPGSTQGHYEGCMDALQEMHSYIEEIKQDYVLLCRGDLCANIDFEKLVRQHLASGADVTGACVEGDLPYSHNRFIPGPDGMAEQLLNRQHTSNQGVASLEAYVIGKQTLLELIRWCAERGRLHFHRDAINHLMKNGGKVGIYMHSGYARHIVNIDNYYESSMDMLQADKRAEIFDLPDRPIVTLERSDVSTYYGDHAKVKNSLVADGCMIEGTVENCIIFGGVKIGAGSTLRNCIIMNDTVIGERVELDCVISDKNVEIQPYVTLNGSSKLPLVIPRDAKL